MFVFISKYFEVFTAWFHGPPSITPKARASLLFFETRYNPHPCTQVDKLASLETFMKDISTGLDAEVPEGPEGKDNLMKVFISERNRLCL